MLKKQAIFAKGNIGLAFAFAWHQSSPQQGLSAHFFLFCKIEKSLPPFIPLYQPPLERKRTDILLRPLYNYYSLTQKIKVLADIGS